MFFTEKEVELANCYNLYYCRFVTTREWYFLTCHNKTASTDRYKTFCHVYKMFWKTVRWRRLTFPPPLPPIDWMFFGNRPIPLPHHRWQLRNHTRFADYNCASTSYGIIRDLPIVIPFPHHTDEGYGITRGLPIAVFRWKWGQRKIVYVAPSIYI